jgi:transporter family protein
MYMTGIIWACAATFIAACVPILAKVGTKKTDPALAGSIAGFYVRLYFFTGKII